MNNFKCYLLKRCLFKEYVFFFLQGNFREENFNTAMNVLQVAGGNAKGDMGMRGRKGGMKGK